MTIINRLQLQYYEIDIISSDIGFQCWSFIIATPHNSVKRSETAYEREQISPNFILLK